MRKILVKLMTLQEIDSELQTLKEARGDLPQKVNELEENVNLIQSQLEQKQTDYKETTTRKHKIEGDVELLKGKLNKYQNQLYQVKNNKEYDAITLEIDNCEKNIEELEYEALELDEKLTLLAESIKETETELENQQKLLKDKKDNLQVMLEETKEQENVLQAKREKASDGISRPLLSSYNRIRINRGGRALAFLLEGACSECSSRIPPQRGLEIRMMDKLYYCEVCGRILVWEAETNAESVNN